MVDAARDGLRVYGTGEETADAADSARHTGETTITFDHLYATYLDRVYAYLRARAPNHEDVADLTQQVFVKVLAALPAYRGSAKAAGPWIFRIARNVLVDSFRRSKESISLELAPEAVAMPAPGTVEAEVERHEAVRRVRTLVAQLKPEEQELLALRFAAGLSSTEIAAVVGKSGASIKKRLTRLIQHLKERYHEPG